MKRMVHHCKQTEIYINIREFSWTIIFEAVSSKRILVKGQSSDRNNKLNNYVTIFGNESFCTEFIPLSYSQMKLISGSFTCWLKTFINSLLSSILSTSPSARRRHSNNCGVLPDRRSPYLPNRSYTDMITRRTEQKNMEIHNLFDVKIICTH